MTIASNINNTPIKLDFNKTLIEITKDNKITKEEVNQLKDAAKADYNVSEEEKDTFTKLATVYDIHPSDANSAIVAQAIQKGIEQKNKLAQTQPDFNKGNSFIEKLTNTAKAREKSNDLKDAAEMYEYIGNHCKTNNNTEKAAEMYSQAANIYMKLGQKNADNQGGMHYANAGNLFKTSANVYEGLYKQTNDTKYLKLAYQTYTNAQEAYKNTICKDLLQEVNIKLANLSKNFSSKNIAYA